MSQIEERVAPASAEFLARYQAMAELCPDILSILDGEGRLLYNSPAAERIHGHRVEDMLGRSTLSYVHPEDVEKIEEAFRRLLEQPQRGVLVRYRYRHANGSWTWMEATGQNRLDNPMVRGIISVSRDISGSHDVIGSVPPPHASPQVQVGMGVYTPGSAMVLTDGDPIVLSTQEARLLDALVARAGATVSVETLLREVWEYAPNVKSRTVYVTIGRLRKKIERNPNAPEFVLAAPGHGYRFGTQPTR